MGDIVNILFIYQLHRKLINIKEIKYDMEEFFKTCMRVRLYRYLVAVNRRSWLFI